MGKKKDSSAVEFARKGGKARQKAHPRTAEGIRPQSGSGALGEEENEFGMSFPIVFHFHSQPSWMQDHTLQWRKHKMARCSDIWKFGGDCTGDVVYYRVSDPAGSIYDEETKAPFEKSGFSIKGGFEARCKPGEQAVITALCDTHTAKLASIHPEWRLKDTADLLAT